MHTSFLKTITSAAALCLVASSAFAAPIVLVPASINQLQNASFEDGLDGWTQGGSPTVTSSTTYPVVAINYGAASQYPIGAFGEAIPAPTNATLSPDAAGTHGAYFVDDAAVNQSLTQSVFLDAGTYRIGFDIYAPNNGYTNPNDATFSAEIAGVTLLNAAVSSGPDTTWTNYSALATILNAGVYDAAFTFNTPGLGAAKDVVVDRVYIVASPEVGGRVIPEPGSLALVGVALAGLAASRKRRSA